MKNSVTQIVSGLRKPKFAPLFRFHRPMRWALAGALAIAAAPVFAPLSQKAHADPTPPLWQNLTQSQLTAAWWQWLYAIPASKSPVFDATGANAYNGQPFSRLFFLAGTFTTGPVNGNIVGQVTRKINVEQGTAFFFPLINFEADNIGCTPALGEVGNGKTSCPFYPSGAQTVPELRAFAIQQINPVTGLYSKLTPTDATFTTPTGPTFNLSQPRLLSPPFAYFLPPAPDNLQALGTGLTVSGIVAPVVADGYYTFIPGTLPPGYYKLEFGGEVPINSVPNYFEQIITYYITVTR